MKNFTFYNPTKVVFGTGNLPSVGEETQAYGKKALLVYGKGSIKKNGLYDQVVDSLKKFNIEIVEHAGVKANPVLSHAREGAEMCKRSGIDVIVAAGGGSVIDEAKSIAAGAKSDADIWDFFLQKASIKDALPIISILSMPATGTEMNNSMVLTNEENNEKIGMDADIVHPKVSFLDPSFTYSISKPNTAYACTDMIAHLAEGYFNTKEEFTPVVDGYIEGIIRGVMKSADRVMQKTDDYDARANIMWGSTLAWNGIGQRGFEGFSLPCHMLEHPLSGLYDIAHGAGLSITIPAWLKFKKEDVRHRIELFGQNILGINPDSTSDLAETTIKELEKWYQKIGTPITMQEAGISEPDIESLAKHADFLSNYMGISEYSLEDLKNIYKLGDERYQ